MRLVKMAGVAAMVGALLPCLFGCGHHPEPWFDGDLESALEEAGERSTLVMVSFKTDWCTWCKRLDQDTFSDPGVAAELTELVALQLDAEDEGIEAAEKYGISSFPSIVFVDAAGREVDRILGYLPPDVFLTEVQRIRAGDTFNSCLGHLNEDPSNLEALERAVEGLLERSDAGAAMVRVEAFHSSHGENETSHRQCERLMFTARSALNESLYRSVARVYRRGWPEVPEVPDSLGVSHLYAMVADLETIDDDREALRSARFDDAQALLATVDFDVLPNSQLLEVADFAYRAGHYESATGLYRRWFDQRRFGEDMEGLNHVSWNLYLMDRERQAAIAMAQEAYDVEREPDVGDTLARLLYVEGKVDEAIEIETRAADTSVGKAAEEFFDVVELMQHGEDLGDRPSFESFPGEQRG